MRLQLPPFLLPLLINFNLLIKLEGLRPFTILKISGPAFLSEFNELRKPFHYILFQELYLLLFCRGYLVHKVFPLYIATILFWRFFLI